MRIRCPLTTAFGETLNFAREELVASATVPLASGASAAMANAMAKKAR
jgi:hypothetical protein